VDIVEHYIKNSSLVDIPVDYAGLLCESTLKKHLGDMFKRKDKFIDLVDSAVAGDINLLDGKGNELKKPNASLWKTMKKQLQSAKSLDDIKTWPNPSSGSEKGDFEKLFGVIPSNFGKDLNGLTGKSGEPTGAEWEHLITYQFNKLVGAPEHKESTEVALGFPKYLEVAKKIAENLKKESAVGSGQMTQFGGGSSSSNCSSWWIGQGGSNGTPKADMITSSCGISLKKKGGSQLMSAGTGETLATFNTALEWFSGDGDGIRKVNELIKQIEDKFDKITTHLGKRELDKLSKLPEEDWPEKSRSDIEKYIEVEAYHKEINKTIKEFDFHNNKKFRDFFVYEAMSGQRKFTGGENNARASLCVEFDDSSGALSKVISTTSDGKKNFTNPPKVSSDISKLAGGAKFYVAWKSSSGNPYSTFRANISEGNNSTIKIPTINEILRKTLAEDALIIEYKKRLLSENKQLNEFQILKKMLSSVKGAGKKFLNWMQGIYKKFLKNVKKALNKIKKLGKDAFNAVLKFAGIEISSVRADIPKDVEQFMY